MKKKLLFVLVAVMLVLCTACRQANIVSYNVSKEADAFNVTRKLTVLNARTDNILLELVGTFSLQNERDDELSIICEVGPGQYQKHIVYLNEWTIYVVEDISSTGVDRYHYELNILPLLNTPQVKIDVTD